MVLKVCSKRICNARVAQWWSIALPRRGSRVRIPSRALKEIEKRVIRWMALFSMFEPCRVRTVRMSTLRSGRRRRTSPGRSATSRALKEIQRKTSDGWLFFLCSSPAGLERFEVLAPLRTFACDISCSLLNSGKPLTVRVSHFLCFWNDYN